MRTGLTLSVDGARTRPRSRRWATRTALAAVTVACAAAAAAAPVQAQAPQPSVTAGFGVDQYGGEISNPVGMAFLPDGSTLVGERSGVLRLIDRVTQKVTQAYDLGSENVCSGVEQGLLGVAVDPTFNAANREGWVYLFYTKKNVSDCLVGDFSYGQPAAAPATNTVSRFWWKGNGILVGTEEVLLENIPNLGGTHNGGDLAIGKDNKLYVSIGDGGCDPVTRTGGPFVGCSDANKAASYQHVLAGKILRINTDGTIPADNPFVANGQACGKVGIGPDASKPCKETWVSGLRNPFRIALDPNTSATEPDRLFWNDVGSNTWEEVNQAVKGDDYGWPAREGFCLLGQSCPDTTPGKPSGATYRNPLYTYRTTPGVTGCKSISGGTFPVNGQFGTMAAGTYLFNDYGCGKIWRATRATNGQLTGVTEFGTNFFGAITMKYNPVTKSVFVIQYSTSSKGRIQEIFPNTGTNLPPRARATVSTDSGTLPLTITLDASESNDPESGKTGLQYIWNLNNGGTVVPILSTTNPVSTYTFPQGTPAVNREITLTVKDPQGKAARFVPKFPVSLGNRPPVVSITTPTEGSLFDVDGNLTLTGTATDPDEQNSLALRWNVIRYHRDHEHPYASAVVEPGQPPFVITGPEPEGVEGAQNSYIIVQLTAIDARGVSRTVERTIQPRKRSITVRTPLANVSPDVTIRSTRIKEAWEEDQVLRPGAQYNWVRTNLWQGWENVEVRVSKRAVDINSQYGAYQFKQWSDGSTDRSRTISEVNSDYDFTALYEPLPEADIGLHTNYYNEMNFTKWVRRSWQEETARTWPGGTPSGVQAGKWSAQYWGKFYVDRTGTYEFTAEADEFIRLKVGTETLIDKFKPEGFLPFGIWTCDPPDDANFFGIPVPFIPGVPWINGPAPFPGFPWLIECDNENWQEVFPGGPIKRDRKAKFLEAGWHDIAIDYANDGGGAYWRLDVAGPGLKKRILDRRELTRNGNPTP